MSEELGLEKAAARTPAVITTSDEYRGALLRWQQQNYHVLTPFANISGLAPSHGIMTSVIPVNNDPTKGGPGEVYDGLPFLKKGEVALAKNGLRRIAEGLGISTRLEHLSVAVIRHYWHVRAIASYRGVDGAPIVREASQEWDLRDGSDRLKGWTPAQISEARKHGLRACETRAINAAIRECGCGLKQAYQRDELLKPFVAIRVAFQPDMSDPETKRLVTERAMQGTAALYPSAPRELPPTVDAFDDAPQHREPQTVGRGSTSAAAQQPTPAADAPAADEPPSEGAVRIVEVREKHGENPNGKKWTRFVIVDSHGVEHSTFDKTLADEARTCLASRAWVDIDEESDGNWTNLKNITPAGQQPSLLPDPSKL